ncbi:MAG: bifunctional pyr operon transcriptional regulator/uracil phosphoribosyltransferase PyrR [Clostridiales bacterium]|nr:bifunctional pyr operon transcriptional regulator/uracil phosphoribosyltransferase PyrR [Clostridiales bacterium]
MGEKKVQIMDGVTMQRSLNRIAFEIIERNRELSELVIVGICRRGAVLARRIAQKLLEIENEQVPVYQIDVTAYRDDVPASVKVGKKPYDIPVAGKRVILVDDVLHTGRTVRAAIDAIFDAGRAECIQLAVLIDRGHRELPFRPDYIGKNLPTSKSEQVQVLVSEYDNEEGVIICGN